MGDAVKSEVGLGVGSGVDSGEAVEVGAGLEVGLEVGDSGGVAVGMTGGVLPHAPTKKAVTSTATARSTGLFIK